MTIKIFNGTQHAINIFRVEDTTSIQDGRKLVVNAGAVPVAIIPPGTNLNCVKENGVAPTLDTHIPLTGAVRFTGADPLPEGFDLYIVSNLYRAALVELGRDTSRLATVNGTVFEDVSAIKPCGCTSLAVG